MEQAGAVQPTGRQGHPVSEAKCASGLASRSDTALMVEVARQTWTSEV